VASGIPRDTAFPRSQSALICVICGQKQTGRVRYHQTRPALLPL
jgi:hypothetical protein